MSNDRSSEVREVLVRTSIRFFYKSGENWMDNQRTRMPACGFFLMILIVPLLSFLPSRPHFTWAAQAVLLGDKHKDLGIQCDGCHKESPPQNKVPTAVCQGCHGDYKTLAERTQKVDPNPHKSHEGDLECEMCHHSHKPSEDRCGSCHNYGFKVP